MQEMLDLANEMGKRIAGDTREWAIMRSVGTFTGPGVVLRHRRISNGFC